MRVSKTPLTCHRNNATWIFSLHHYIIKIFSCILIKSKKKKTLLFTAFAASRGPGSFQGRRLAGRDDGREFGRYPAPRERLLDARSRVERHQGESAYAFERNDCSLCPAAVMTLFFGFFFQKIRVSADEMTELNFVG